MEELKKDVKTVKSELAEELKRLKDATELIKKVRVEQKNASVVHKQELKDLEECVKHTEINIAQHDERLRAFEEHAKRQNGLLGELTHGIDTVTKKVDALSLEFANKFAESERHAITRDLKRDTEVSKALADANANTAKALTEANSNVAKALAEANANIVTAKEKADAELDVLRKEVYEQRITEEKEASKDKNIFYWKIIGAVGAVAFILFIVVLTILTHTFGALPGLP
jgi:hypothetical protein